MCNPDDTIVWEWLDEHHRWRPYSAEVSNFVHKSYENFKMGKGPATVDGLSHFDPHLGVYMLNFTNMSQTRKGIGTQRQIRQKVYNCDGAISKGRIWSWETDKPGHFQTFDFEVCELLEQYYKKDKHSKVDLSNTPCGLPYWIDFKALTQMRHETRRARKIKREKKTLGYLTAKHVTNNQKGTFLGSKSGSVGPTGMFVSASSSSHSQTGFGQSSSLGTALGPIGHGASHLPLVSTGSIAGPVTRSSVRKSTSATNIPSGWHPPMSLPGSIASQKPPGAASKRTKVKAKKKIKKISKVRPKLAPMGSITNCDQGGNAAAFGGARSKKAKTKGVDFDFVIQKYTAKVKRPPKDEDCCICMTELTEVSAHKEDCTAVIKLKCTHMFHQSCLEAMYNTGTQDGSIQCPKCKTIFGVKYGNCPIGTMTYNRLASSIPSYESCGVIQVCYNIPQGIQGKEHPNPGERYVTQGFPRVGFLPDNEEGEKILRLLITAWQRRLTFTIGTSVTTGLTNAVVWNEIHHKTEISNHSGHGYPDPKYFDNVTLELASQGVIESDDDSDEEDDNDSGNDPLSEDSDDDL